MACVCLSMTDLPSDIVKVILIRVAGSSNGAIDIVRVICTCKTAYKFIEDPDVLKAVCFDRLMVSNDFKSLQNYYSLVARCASIGHPKATSLLAKVVLKTATQVLVNTDARIPQDYGAILYMIELFLEMVGSRQLDGSELHLNSVRFFLQSCNPTELKNMRIHLDNYLEHFVLFSNIGHEDMYIAVDKMCQTVDIEEFCDRWEQWSIDLLPEYEEVFKWTGEPWKPKERLIDVFSSLDARVELLIMLWERLQGLVPRLDEAALGYCDNCYYTFIDDVGLITTDFEIHRLIAVATLDAAFPRQRSVHRRCRRNAPDLV